eukprot:IDg8950t1
MHESALSEVFYENAWCVGLIDGTKIKVARPSDSNSHQRCVYSGHKRFHCLTYQTVTTPDRLIFHIYGPIEGRRPDTYLYRKSGLEEHMKTKLIIEGTQHYIYGDSAYVLRPWLQTAFPRSSATSAQLTHNATMNSASTAVEWSYGEVRASFTTQDFHRKLMIRKLPVALPYIVSVLLRKFKTCIGHGSLPGAFFNCTPPTLERYCTQL